MYRVRYIARETLQNLRRNLVLSLASLLTVAVSLGMVGSALLLRDGVGNATKQWREGIEFEIFFNADATDEQIAAVQESLAQSPQVASTEFFDKASQWSLFTKIFADRPEFLVAVSQENMPPSFRVDPKVDDATAIQALGASFEGQPGVKSVEFPEEQVRKLLEFSAVMQRVILAVAVVVLLAAGLLIFNSIRLAIFSRRREIEVMKLVGATNWFIRIPFMIEGLIQGFLGAAIAFAFIYLASGRAENVARKIDLLSDFVLVSSQITAAGTFMLVLGAAIGALSAAVAVSRFLDV